MKLLKAASKGDMRYILYSGLYSKEEQIRSGFIFFAMSFLIIVGFWLRIRNLGGLGLIGDEGIQAIAVKGILKYGVPRVETGFTYTRSLPFLYLQAAAAKLFELNAFWLRLPSAIFGVAVIIPSYFLGKALFSRRIGLLTAAIIAFSVWEIELSRYARFYTFFQFGFLLSLVCFYKGFMQDEGKYKIMFLLTALFTFSTHKLGEVIILLFLIPIIYHGHTRYRKLIIGLWAVGTIVLFKAYLKFVSLMFASGNAVFAENEGQATATPAILEKVRTTIGLPSIDMPDMTFLLHALRQHQIQVAGIAAIAGSATLYFIYRYFKGCELLQVLIAAAMVWSAFFYKFGIVVILFAVYLVIFFRNFQTLWEPMVKIVYGVVAICFVFWVKAIKSAPQVSFKNLIDVLFGYPNIYKYFLKWLVLGWPIMTLFLVLGCIFLLWQYISDRSRPALLFAPGALLFPVFFPSFFSAYPESRYFFHLYPLIVTIFSLAIVLGIDNIFSNLPLKRNWARNLLKVFLVIIVFFISQDANPLDAWFVSNRTYQSKRDPIRSVISWKPYARFHQDYVSPSLFVKKNLSAGDKVITLGPLHMQVLYYYYIGKIDYNVVPSDKYGLLIDGKIVNYVIGSQYIGELSKLKQLIKANRGKIWILADRAILSEENNYYSESTKKYLRGLVKKPDFMGMDGKTLAVRVN